MTSKTSDLVQVLIILFFIFFDYSSNNSNSWSIRELTLFLILVWIKTLFSSLAQSLAQLASLATATSIMISKNVGDFLNLRVFLVLKVSFHQPIAMETISIALLGHKSKLIGYFSLSIDASFYNLLLIIDIPISFVKI